MIRSTCNVLIVTLFFFLSNLCFSQRALSAHYSSVDSAEINYNKIIPADDSLIIEHRIIEDNELDAYKNDPDFNYENNQSKPEDWFAETKNWVYQQILNLTTSKTFSTIMDFVYYGLMILALILVLRGLFRGDRGTIFFGKVQNEIIKYSEINEGISEINFDILISFAIQNKDYKLAVRYLFLKSLQLLSKKEIIELRENKTNHQYLSEIKDSHLLAAFRKTIYRFELVWYGDFPVDENVFQSSQKEFSELFGLLSA